jgi:hypothetical protein
MPEEQRPLPSSTPNASATEDALDAAISASTEDIVAASPGIAIEEDKFKVQMELNLEQDVIEPQTGEDDQEEAEEVEEELEGDEEFEEAVESPDEVDEETIVALNKAEVEASRKASALQEKREDDKESVISDVDPIGTVSAKESQDEEKEEDMAVEDVIPELVMEGEESDISELPPPNDSMTESELTADDDQPISPPEGFDPIDDVLEPDFKALPTIRKEPSINSSSSSETSKSSGGDTVKMMKPDPVKGDNKADDSQILSESIEEEKEPIKVPQKIPYGKALIPLTDDDAEELALLQSDPYQRDPNIIFDSEAKQKPKPASNGHKAPPPVNNPIIARTSPARPVQKKQPPKPRQPVPPYLQVKKSDDPGYLMDNLLEKESRKTGVRVGLVDPGDSAFESEDHEYDSPNEDFIARVKKMAAQNKVRPFFFNLHHLHPITNHESMSGNHNSLTLQHQ